ncbi:chemotaxis protein CheY [Marinomonas ushuaiensis DSM 15871]|uniref:Chemotaxis protein CheY n=1 Tax=Marinomonas ushuaiensis DSM 15871 TaxID=1122207 RepID=X7E8H0_9GAMM|nr:HD domain-containing phosphohydrolase [Marinomonas ushuaiensis]ETX12364.1 chemotaxis protein CheY [Marinomonas ushuaiensis DSM 15871]
MIIDKKISPRILLVDDEPTNLRILRHILQDYYKLSFAKSGEAALDLIAKEEIDLILLDVMMPNMTGHEVCRTLKSNAATKEIPVIFVTALKDAADEEQGFDIGAVDYITKPVVPAVVLARVKTHLSLTSVAKLHQTHLDLIQRLGRAAEYKDNETGMHVQRMSRYTRELALAYGFCEDYANDLMMAAPMHDIGKIGIADNILLKPGKLTAEEYEIMKTHVQIGAEILSNPRSHLIQLAHIMALSHHEKWDGSGYPNGLSKDDIPIEGRLIAVADVFDALTSERPYKRAWSIDEAVNYIFEQSGSHFDPAIPPLLKQVLPKLLEIKTEFSEVTE